MTTCYDSGTLRAYLDDELPAGTQREIMDHLRTCSTCSAQLAGLEALDSEIAGHLATPPAVERPTEAAFAEVMAKAKHISRPTPAPLARLSRRARVRGIGGAIAAAILLALLFVPQVRVAADQLLSVFRAQSVAYVSISPSRVQQLEQLSKDRGALFISKPTVVGAPPSQQQVASSAQAAALAGFTPREIHTFSGTPDSTTYAVQSQGQFQFQVNVQTLRTMLQTLGVTDVTIPDALGQQPVKIALPPAVKTTYSGSDYTLTLIQGESPTVTLPAGVDLNQLGRAALEVYGMSPQQAASLSSQINWGSTLVFPFPTGASDLQQVDINGAQGMLLDVSRAAVPGQQSASQASGTGEPHYVLYWQQGSHFFILDGSGAVGTTYMVAAASSVR